MDTLNPPPPAPRPSGLPATALLGIALLATGPAALAQNTNLRLPADRGMGATLPAWGTTTSLLGLDAAMAGVDYRLLVSGAQAEARAPSWLPRISIGLQQRSLSTTGLPPPGMPSGLRPLGLERSSEADLVIGASRMVLDQSLQLHGALRNTPAGTAMLPGFGPGTAGRGERQWQPELGVAYLLRSDLAIGAEYRFRPTGNTSVGVADEDAKDVYLSWAPRRDMSLSVGWADIGRSGGTGIAPRRSLTGFYVAGQVAF